MTTAKMMRIISSPCTWIMCNYSHLWLTFPSLTFINSQQQLLEKKGASPWCCRNVTERAELATMDGLEKSSYWWVSVPFMYLIAGWARDKLWCPAGRSGCWPASWRRSRWTCLRRRWLCFPRLSKRRDPGEDRRKKNLYFYTKQLKASTTIM